MTTQLRPFFSFYGGKWLKARHYPKPTHDTIIEPFAGSAGYSVRNYERNVQLFDADPIICGVWDFLIRATSADITALPSNARQLDDLPASTPQEARWLIGFWLNPGSAMPKRTMSKWKTFEHSNGGQLYWGDRVKERLLAQVSYIRHWTIGCCEYQNLSGAETATWFVDPPYQKGGAHYRVSLRGNDFEKLGEWCRTLSGQVIVCERTGADWLPFVDLYEGRSAKYQFSKEAVFIA